MFNASMQYRNMGKSGLRLSALGLGGWTTYGASVKAEDTVRSIIRAAYEAGINFFDISDIYEKGEAEKSMGAVFRELPRHELVISTKCFWPMSEDVNDTGLSRKHIMESLHKSLKRIGTDYVDIYFCHRPDPNTPAEETAGAMIASATPRVSSSRSSAWWPVTAFTPRCNRPQPSLAWGWLHGARSPAAC
jgi:aryl-alcohol dehydrogenase-like predicted oxidoreductase